MATYHRFLLYILISIMDTFLTENKNQQGEVSNLPESLLNEHRKLATVVNSFGVKVEAMIEKQRGEYVQAYGHHMRDVQKELHLLREKATAIANDRTRDEKIKKLDSDQKWYRTEAVKLDSETNILRMKLKSLTGNITSVERERDWLLAKLREAKGKYNELQAVRQLKSSAMMEEGMSLLSNDSSYTLDLDGGASAAVRDSKPNPNPNPNKQQQWKSRLENDFGVSRDQAMLGALSHMVVPADPGDYGSVSTLGHGSQQNLGRSSSANAVMRKPNMRSGKSKRTLGKLVAARAKHESLADFIAQNARSCTRGSFYNLAKLDQDRPTDELVNACLQHLVDTNYNPNQTDADFNDGYSSIAGSSVGGGYKEGTYFHQLVKELACSHDAYIAISDIMSGMVRNTAMANEPEISNSRPASPSSATQNEISFVNVESRGPTVNVASSVPVPFEPTTALPLDRDIAGYLNQGSDRRIARLEAKLSRSSSGRK